MRWWLALALISTLVSPDALAQGKRGKGKKKGKNKQPAATMDTGTDPVVKEASDPGPYTPKGKTGALAEKQERKDEVEEVVKAKPRDKKLLFADFLLGLGQAPAPGPASAGNNHTNEAKAFGLVLGGALDVSPTLTLGLRIPWSTASIERSDGSGSDSSMAFGSPQLFGEVRHHLSELWTLPILFGIGVPLAQGNPDPSSTTSINDAAKARVGLLVDAAGGWRDGELYAPKRLPLVVGIGVHHAKRSFEFHAYTKLVAGINLGTEIVNPNEFGMAPNNALGRLELNSVSLRNVTLVGVRYDLTNKPVLWIGADLWAVYNPLEPIEFESSATPPSPFQFVAEPRVGAAFGKLRPSLGFVYPIGGRLSDSGIMGFRLHIDYAL
jgi:hypothetical protein